jgi:hypothetical protein
MLEVLCVVGSSSARADVALPGDGPTMMGPARVTASPGGKRGVSCHGRGGVAVGTLQAEAVADVGLRDPGGNDPRVRTAPPEYNLPVISRLPGI